MSETAVWQVLLSEVHLSNSSRLEVQLHWRLCRRSWCASVWREAYECQPSAVCLCDRCMHWIRLLLAFSELNDTFILSTTPTELFFLSVYITVVYLSVIVWRVACQSGFFGTGCRQVCSCPENSFCDHVTGDCICRPGHRGRHCRRGQITAADLLK